MQKPTSESPMHSGRLREDDDEVHFFVREAIAYFADEGALESAILALQEAGIDRSRISVLGRLPPQGKAGSARNWMRHLVDIEDAPRGAPTDRATLAEAETAVVALPGYGGAMLGLIAVMASGGALGLAVATAILTGAMGSGAGYLLARSIGEHHGDEVASQLEAGGLVLWVALKGDDETVAGILRDANGAKVHVNEHEGHWGADDVPLSTVQPDPFL